MGIDLIVAEQCDAKRHFGDGDCVDGTHVILALLKKRSRAIKVCEMMKDVPPAEINFVVVVNRPDGPVEEEVNAGALLAEASALDDHTAGCAGCPANVQGAFYGCVGYVNYPISLETEEALIARLEPPERLGGHIFLDAVRDFGYDGSPMYSWRSSGLLAPEGPALRTLPGGVETSSDVILQALFGVGHQLGAFHCVLVLLWLGALEIDGEVPRALDPAPVKALMAMPLEELAARTNLVPIGDEAADTILAFLYAAGVRRAPLFLDS